MFQDWTLILYHEDGRTHFPWRVELQVVLRLRSEPAPLCLEALGA